MCIRDRDYGLSYADAMLMGMGCAFKVVGRYWPLLTPEGRQVDMEEILRYASNVVSNAILRHMIASEIDPISGMYLYTRIVYGEADYDSIRLSGYGLGVDHEVFIRKYCEKPKIKDGNKVYPIKPLTKIAKAIKERLERLPLVDALALAVERYLNVGVKAALEVLDVSGYGRDPRVLRYIEVLLREGTLEECEKQALQGLALELRDLKTFAIGFNNARSTSEKVGQLRLDDFLEG